MDFITNIQLNKHLLTKNELIACEKIIENMELVQRLSFTELSEEIEVTKASILRFCKKVGYSGYNEFKYECIKYVNSINDSEEEMKSEITKIDKVSQMYAKVINLMNEVLKEEEIIRLVRAIKSSKRTKAVGVINSEIPALQLKYAFLMFGIEIDVVDSEEKLKVLDMSITNEDLIIIFSVSAKNKIVQRALDIKANNGAKVAVITMNREWEDNKNVDYFITLPPISNLKNQSLLNSVPIFSVFIEILNVYYNSI